MISPGESGANMKYWEIIADNLSKRMELGLRLSPGSGRPNDLDY